MTCFSHCGLLGLGCSCHDAGRVCCCVCLRVMLRIPSAFLFAILFAILCVVHPGPTTRRRVGTYLPCSVRQRVCVEQRSCCSATHFWGARQLGASWMASETGGHAASVHSLRALTRPCVVTTNLSSQYLPRQVGVSLVCRASVFGLLVV